jgi:hypothetical protein
MATLLRRLRLKRVSLVDTPANEQARVVLFKSSEMSTERVREAIEQALRSTLGDSWIAGGTNWFVEATFDDRVIVRQRGELYSYPYSLDESGKVVLGERKASEITYKMQPTSTEVNVDGFAECKKCGAQVAKGAAKCQKCDAPMGDMSKAEDRLKEDKMDEKLKADLATAQTAVEDLTKKLETATTENAELKKKLDTPEAIERRKLEALPEAVRKQLEEDRVEIQKLRGEQAESTQIDDVKKSMPQLPGKPEDTGKLLKRVKDVVKAEDFEALTTMLRAASAQIEKGELYREVGKSGHGGDPVEAPLAQIARLTAELVSKSKDMKQADAEAQVIREHPELYNAYSRSVLMPVGGAKANADAD